MFNMLNAISYKVFLFHILKAFLSKVIQDTFNLTFLTFIQIGLPLTLWTCSDDYEHHHAKGACWGISPLSHHYFSPISHQQWCHPASTRPACSALMRRSLARVERRHPSACSAPPAPTPPPPACRGRAQPEHPPLNNDLASQPERVIGSTGLQQQLHEHITKSSLRYQKITSVKNAVTWKEQFSKTAAHHLFWSVLSSQALTCMLLFSSLFASVLREGQHLLGKPANRLRRRVVLVSLTMWQGWTMSSASKSL